MRNSLISAEDKQMAIEFLLSVVRDENVKTSHRIRAARALLKYDAAIATDQSSESSTGLN